MRCAKFVRNIFAAAASCLLIPPALAADHPEPHDPPLPLPANYGNIGGCLVLHGDRADPTAMWLTPREMGGADFICRIISWRHDPHGALSFECDHRRFLILPQNSSEQMLLVIQLTGQQSFATYQLGQCAGE